ncbi:MAG TPA: FGGY family carbohydrate kinase [Saprospiraceae bacterium]|nr:FGGY family carbohydrate kinase [Saprospiraceae bacterium]HPN70219.1 FGGY family carbohydrate kinase [Saprospiraceae bacterium]
MNTLIFDIGKTNKKWFVFNQSFEVIARDSIIFAEGKDDDGDPCEDLQSLTEWVLLTANKLIADDDHNISKINFSAYGASVVHLNENQEVCAPLYNYLKKPTEVNEDSFKEYLSQYPEIEKQTGAAISGMLNTGFQLYWLKMQKADVFKSFRKTVHLPQYFSFLFTGETINELTSLGCHTTLWDFKNQQLHKWLSDDNLISLMPALSSKNSYSEITIQGRKIQVGNGIHDSSAALVPYKTGISSPFILLSSGTWSISLNPFAQEDISQNDIDQELIYYLQPDGKKVRATRLYYGKIYEEEVARIQISEEEIRKIPEEVVDYYFKLKNSSNADIQINAKQRAYLGMVVQIAMAHLQSLQLAKGESHIEEVYVDGGFAKNDLFLRFLATMLFPIQVFKAENPMGSALGAAIMMDQNSFTPDIFRDRYNLKLVLSHYNKMINK